MVLSSWNNMRRRRNVTGWLCDSDSAANRCSWSEHVSALLIVLKISVVSVSVSAVSRHGGAAVVCTRALNDMNERQHRSTWLHTES